jgi:GxxExxY protein
MADFVCFENIIVEIKAIKQITGIEEAQLINYLKATQLPLGLLINFGAEKLEWKRYANTKK